MCHSGGSSSIGTRKTRIFDPNDGNKWIDPFDVTDPRNWGTLGDDPRVRGGLDPRLGGDPSLPADDPRNRGLFPDDPKRGGLPPEDPRLGGGPFEDPRNGGGGVDDPRGGGAPGDDPGTLVHPGDDPRTKGAPLDPEVAGLPPEDTRVRGEPPVDERNGGLDLKVAAPAISLTRTAALSLGAAGLPANDSSPMPLLSPAAQQTYLQQKGFTELASALRVGASKGWSAAT